MLDIAGVVLSAVSVYQGWKRDKTDAEGKMADLKELLAQLGVLDSIFFGAKKIHDGTESFFKATPDTIKILSHAHEGAVSPNDITKNVKTLRFHFEDYKDKLPHRFEEIDTNLDVLDKDEYITAEIKNDVAKLIVFYKRMVLKLDNLMPVYNELIHLDEEKSLGHFTKTLHSLTVAMKDLLRDTDKVIFYGASIVAFIHTEINRSLNK